METKANYTIVGFFTVLVIAAAFGFDSTKAAAIAAPTSATPISA